MRVKLFRQAPFARTGTQQYQASEIGKPGDSIVSVNRPEIEVRRSGRTFEGVPITIEHPDDMVTAGTVDQLAVGLVSGVRFDDKSGQLKGDLLIWDEDAIQAVAMGRRELSAGYCAEYEPDGDGFFQRDIKGNHVALVPRGRSGSAQRIGG